MKRRRCLQSLALPRGSGACHIDDAQQLVRREQRACFVRLDLDYSVTMVTQGFTPNVLHLKRRSAFNATRNSLLLCLSRQNSGLNPA